MVEIALDAMGGDHAPKEIVRGALRAIEQKAILREELILVGHKEKVAAELRAAGADPAAFSIVHAPEVIGMDESPLEALKRKRHASISVATELVHTGKAAAVVSAGHTGAAVAIAKLRLGTLTGIRRPGIAVAFDSMKGPTVLIDVGANVSCKPVHLFQYGLMGHAYARDVLGLAAPQIGLLNIGEEEEKGNTVVRETHELFRASGLPFVGNVEGQDIFRGKADVLVSDGFVGNVVLKTSEGLGEFLFGLLARELEGVLPKDKAQKVLQRVTSRVDYGEHGGALLVGVEGIVVIGHGRSDARAAAAMLATAKRYVAADVNRHIVAALGPTATRASKSA